MSKILVVEPYKMMQQAIVLALFPAHEVQIVETLPDSNGIAAIRDYDVVVMDAAALREKNGLSAQAAGAIQDSRVPIIWLESEDGSGVANRDRLVVLHRPITRDSLSAALAQCLGPPSTNKLTERADGTETERQQSARGAAKEKKKKTAAADRPQSQIIELVDVVEEPLQQKADKPKTKS
jgi:hypothetical protein